MAVVALAAAGVIATETARRLIATPEIQSLRLSELPMRAAKWLSGDAAPHAPELAPETKDPDVAPDAAPAAGPQPIVLRDPFSPDPDAPTEFITLALADGETFCRSLQNTGLNQPVFQRLTVPSHGWTCVPDMLKPVDGAESVVSSLFVTVRGEVADRLSSLRIKLNLIDPATAPLAREKAKDVLTQMLAVFGGVAPERVLQAINFGVNVAVVDRGVTYELKKEFGDPRRANLLVVFPQQLGDGGEARFIEKPEGIRILPSFRP
ncbi:DUF6030 family protein [Hansschlegelia quercus]|uniref:Uncharacterized protein n=1 Tax=Hansschlegelia quercus TaxID=2528245 RepID=A0A4Q9GI86_9HYPH|nr:DUF6030 family protein [Hansschlegelia quercus]TBN53913.1 hypothetical protein EYR15_09010 [Hansschlegelia quercus]